MSAYSSIVSDHFFAPRNAGRLDKPDAIGIVGDPGAGPFMVFHLQISDASVCDVKYQTYGCGPAIAAGSMLTTLILGRPIAECLGVSTEELVDRLGGLPADKVFCASMAIEAVQKALRSIG